ncbi:MAG TPA: PRTRC system protein C [Candidatus Polarisedimenticolia bacterium]|nr:PRTRC system protein C [Candidatus Polarisedimenticolia bacterium]
MSRPTHITYHLEGVVYGSTSLKRESVYNGVKLLYTIPTLTPEPARETYAHFYPEIATAAIEGPETVSGKPVYKFVRAMGAKG